MEQPKKGSFKLIKQDALERVRFIKIQKGEAFYVLAGISGAKFKVQFRASFQSDMYELLRDMKDHTIGLIVLVYNGSRWKVIEVYNKNDTIAITKRTQEIESTE